jgi:lauroyl/myristoyl acyltransferase
MNPPTSEPGLESRERYIHSNPSVSPGPNTSLIGRTGRPIGPANPSSLYKARFWQLGVNIARHTPHFLLGRLASHLVQGYGWANPGRRRIVFENLLPALHGDRQSAKVTTRELFSQFGLKLADLWRYESGLSIYNLFHDLTGWEHFEAAQAKKRGVLLLTIHLGNWEFGAPLLTQRGVRLQVITQAEPQAQLTAMRQAARARWGIETLALGDNPFAAVEIIRRLEANNCVALLMDRPPKPTSTTVSLFGQPFAASISAAELARASGCALLPVYLPRTSRGYVAHILPEIAYERPALRDRNARLLLTQGIMNAFEPAIRLFLNQWYHFVPIWPAGPSGSDSPG